MVIFKVTGFVTSRYKGLPVGVYHDLPEAKLAAETWLRSVTDSGVSADGCTICEITIVNEIPKCGMCGEIALDAACHQNTFCEYED